MRQIKLIWDFRGPNALKIAKHHEVHLKDFIQQEALKFDITGVETITDFHTLAFMVVPEDQMKYMRDTLKPHRGQVYTES